MSGGGRKRSHPTGEALDHGGEETVFRGVDLGGEGVEGVVGLEFVNER